MPPPSLGSGGTEGLCFFLAAQSQVGDQSLLVLVQRQLAHEAAVQPAQLALVEDPDERPTRSIEKRWISSWASRIVVSSSVPQPSRAR